MTASRAKVLQDEVLSGGAGLPVDGSQAGYAPVPISHVPVAALARIPVYIKPHPNITETRGKRGYVRYDGPAVEFTEKDRKRLLTHDIQFLYIRTADHDRFRRQTEETLEAFAADASVATSTRSTVVYESSVELINELLGDLNLAARVPRIESVSRAVTNLVISDPSAFTHLFCASSHAFYTATHMVNVATWMVPLAHALGCTDQEELGRICQAGLVHDIGKIEIPCEILNKKEHLSDDEWDIVRRHPELGAQCLQACEGLAPIVAGVALEHHERLDGSGYPRGLKADDIHPISRICAVVDSFDAMTAFRPFKERTLSVPEALDVLKRETPSRYAPDVVEAWLGLLDAVPEVEMPATQPIEPSSAPGDDPRRHHQRFPFHCPANVNVLEQGRSAWIERETLQVVAHNLSRSGLGFLSRTPVRVGDYLRVYLHFNDASGRVLQGWAVRCRRYPDGWYEVGVKFATP